MHAPSIGQTLSAVGRTVLAQQGFLYRFAEFGNCLTIYIIANSVLTLSGMNKTSIHQQTHVTRYGCCG